MIIKVTLSSGDNYTGSPCAETPDAVDYVGCHEFFTQYGLNNPVYDEERMRYLFFIQLEALPPSGYSLLADFQLSQVGALERSYVISGDDGPSPIADILEQGSEPPALYVNLGLISVTLGYMEVNRPWAASLMCEVL